MDTGQKPRYIISTGWIASEVRIMMASVALEANVLDYASILQHRVDCYLYGSLFIRGTIDPLEESMSAFCIPSDYRQHINNTLSNYLDRVLSEAIPMVNPDLDYLIAWPDPYTAIIEPVLHYGYLAARAKEREAEQSHYLTPDIYNNEHYT